MLSIPLSRFPPVALALNVMVAVAALAVKLIALYSHPVVDGVKSLLTKAVAPAKVTVSGSTPTGRTRPPAG